MPLNGQPLYRPSPVGFVEYTRLALILDDEAGQTGELALRLMRVGVNVYHANHFDETVLLARVSHQHTMSTVSARQALTIPGARVRNSRVRVERSNHTVSLKRCRIPRPVATA